MLIEVDDDFDDDANISNDANINDDDAEHCMLIEVDTCIHSHFPPHWLSACQILISSRTFDKLSCAQCSRTLLFCSRKLLKFSGILLLCSLLVTLL